MQNGVLYKMFGNVIDWFGFLVDGRQLFNTLKKKCSAAGTAVVSIMNSTQHGFSEKGECALLVRNSTGALTLER